MLTYYFVNRIWLKRYISYFHIIIANIYWSEYCNRYYEALTGNDVMFITISVSTWIQSSTKIGSYDICYMWYASSQGVGLNTKQTMLRSVHHISLNPCNAGPFVLTFRYIFALLERRSRIVVHCAMVSVSDRAFANILFLQNIRFLDQSHSNTHGLILINRIS